MEGKMNINIHDFKTRFDREYGFLYQHEDRVAGYDEAVAAFDELLDNDFRGMRKFVGDFVDYRGDFISSDREAAAFMFAMASFGCLK